MGSMTIKGIGWRMKLPHPRALPIISIIMATESATRQVEGRAKAPPLSYRSTFLVLPLLRLDQSRHRQGLLLHQGLFSLT